MNNLLFFAVNKDIDFGDAALYSLIGFVIILAILVVLALLISLLTFLAGKMRKKAAPSAPVDQLAPGSGGTVKLFGVPDKEAAMVMAIVAEELKTPLNELKFISIKEKKENED